uniref:CD248 molecule, endosialin a n=1 Tax=Amphiprion percula TaxID=161767 RepID=A0A3P8SYY4_AMPPE
MVNGTDVAHTGGEVFILTSCTVMCCLLELKAKRCGPVILFIFWGQDLRDRDALCNADGCFVVYFQRKTFLDSWKACKEKDGNLATIKTMEDATTIETLFSTLDLRHSRTKIQVWIGLQRQPRQCTITRPLRGFSWTTGDQDTEYTNWQKEDSPSMCSVPRCVVMSYSTQERNNNFKWLDGSCSVPVDGYLCHYAYKGMCHALWSEGGGNALYTTPFNLISTLLTHVPFGSVASVPCPTGTKEEQSVLCMLREDGSVGWSRNPPLCSDPSISHNWCDQDNGGCEHFCRTAGGHFYCECADGYQLGDDGQSCEVSDVCQGAPCEFECLPLSDGYRCACPDGYMLAPDERGCLDVDECLQSPCEQLCENAPGTFECRCREGYHLDVEGGCEDIDECMNDPCEHACENTPGSHICHCHLGFSQVPEDPSRCQDTDECQIPGTCEQMCVNYDGGFECYCEEGYELMSNHYSSEKDGEDIDEEITTPLPSLSTSTINEGAWNWWEGIATSSMNPGNPVDSFPKEELGEEGNDYVEITHSQGLAVPTQPAASQPPLSEGGGNGDSLDSFQEDRGQKQSSTWLLVGLLVPICIFIVVMVALGIVYCTRCAVQPRNKNATDCYHWISGAHDKQGAIRSQRFQITD